MILLIFLLLSNVIASPDVEPPKQTLFNTIPAYPTCQPCHPYIRRWYHIIDEYNPHVFGDVGSPTNIWGWSKLIQMPYIFDAKSKPIMN
jgi:hypothetical protein